MGLVLIIAYTSARNVRSDSSLRLVPCSFSSATKIEHANPIKSPYIYFSKKKAKAQF